MKELTIDKAKTSLVVIDLQKGIVSQPTKPYLAQEVIKNASKLVNVFRKHNMPVFLVHVIITKETMLNVLSDESFLSSSAPSSDWSEFVPEMSRRILLYPKDNGEHFMEQTWNSSYTYLNTFFQIINRTSLRIQLYEHLYVPHPTYNYSQSVNSFILFSILRNLD